MVEKYKMMNQIQGSKKTESKKGRKIIRNLSQMNEEARKELGIPELLPFDLPNSVKNKKGEISPQGFKEVLMQRASSESNDEKWEGLFIENGKETKIEFENVDIEFNQLRIKMNGSDPKGALVIQGHIEEGGNFVDMELTRLADAQGKVEKYIQGKIIKGGKGLDCFWSIHHENVLENVSNVFKIFQLVKEEIQSLNDIESPENRGNPEAERKQDDEDSITKKDDEKSSGFLMQNISPELTLLVLTDLPSPLFVFNNYSRKIELTLPISIQNGASALEISEDRKLVGIAGTMRAVYLINIDFILTKLLKKPDHAIQQAYEIYKANPELKKKLIKAAQASKEEEIPVFPPRFLVSLEKYHRDRIQMIKFLTSSRKMITCGGKFIKVLCIDRLSVESTFETRHSDTINKFLIMEGEKRILTVSLDKSIILTDLMTGREVQYLPNASTAPIVGVHYDEQQNRLILGGADGEFTIRESFVYKDFLGINGLVRIEGKDWIEKSNQTQLFRYYLKREPFFPKVKVDFYLVLFMIWDNISLFGLQELLDNGAELKVVPVLNSFNISAFEMFEVFQPPPIFSELLFYFYFRRMKSITRSEYLLSEQLVSAGLVYYFIQRKGRNILTHFFTGMMIENATCNPGEVYIRGKTIRKFTLSDQLFCDYSGNELYNPVGTTPLKVLRSKIRIENADDWTSQLLLRIFQIFLGFSNLSSYPIETTQQYLLYLKTRTWKFAYVYIFFYISNCILMTIQVIYFKSIDEQVRNIMSMGMIADNFIMMLAEFIQLAGQGAADYFSTIGNYIEISQISLTFIFCFLSIFFPEEFKPGSDDSRILTYSWLYDIMALTVMLMYLRIARIIQYIDQFRSLILKLNKILVDMIPVSIVLAVLVFGFALIYYIAGLWDDIENSILDYIGLSWDTSFGNYDREDLTRGNQPFGFIIYLVSIMALPLVLLNFIIAVMGDTLNNISDDLLALDSVSKLAVCLDFLFTQTGLVRILKFLRGRRQRPIEQIFDNSKFLYVVYEDKTPAIKEETGSEIVESGLVMEDEKAAAAVDEDAEEKKELNIEDISQSVTRLTFEQITKMRERIEKTMQTLVNKAVGDAETSSAALMTRMHERVKELEERQKEMETQLKRLDMKLSSSKDEGVVDKWGVPLGYGVSSGFISDKEGLKKTNRIQTKQKGASGSMIHP